MSATPNDNAVLTPEQAAQEQLEAYNQRDLARFVAVYHEDVEVFRPPQAEPTLRGRDALAEHYAARRFNLPGLRADLLGRIVMGNKVFDHELVHGVKPAPFEAAAVYEVVDGRIRRVWFFAPE